MAIDIVLDYPKIKNLLAEDPSVRKEIFKIYNEMAATYSESSVKKLEGIFDASFAKLYTDINLVSQSDTNIKALAKDTHLILCPNHQSYADFLAISYAFYKKLSLPVFIAAGMNLNVFPIGKIFRKGGAFFIRRSFRGDVLYKTVLEAYIFSLLKEQKIIKFYFEGARSRTGRLLAPRFGLFQILLEAYSHLNSDKPVCFLPISISHEALPEARAHRAEVSGGKKVKESTAQLFKIFRVFSKHFGSIHLRASSPIHLKELKPDQRKQVQDLAFSCFHAVGKQMMVSPTSLLSMVLLDNISGALTKKHIYARAEAILGYCQDFNVPISPNLQSDWQNAISESLNLLIESKKIKKIKSEALNKTFYSVLPDSRIELLYLKNTILHHFLIPFFIGGAWINILRGSIDNIEALREYFVAQRRLLRHEFYLPKTEEMFTAIKFLVATTLDRNAFSFADSFSLDRKDFYKLGAILSPYTASFAHIYEAYYIAALSLRSLGTKAFSIEDFKKYSHEIFVVEKDFGKLIRYPESYSVSIMQTALIYYKDEGILQIIENDGEVQYGLIKDKAKKLDTYVEKFATLLSDFTALNIKKFQT